MNTLHTYHWQGPEVLQSHLPLMGDADALVIYGQLDSTILAQVKQFLIDCTHQWYWHAEAATQQDTDDHRIGLDQWLEMMVACHNSWAWK